MGEVLDWLVAMLQQMGASGVLVYALAYAAAALLLLPCSVFTATAGYVYGPFWGTLVAWPVSAIASCGPFLLSRTVLRNFVTKQLARYEKMQALDRAVGRKGVKLVALMRLSPVIPANVSNYALGITRIELRDYFFGTLLGAFLPTAMYAYLGSAAHDVAALVRGTRDHATPLEQVLFWGGLVATVVGVMLVTRVTKRELAREL